jgi:contractile injection system tube protein
MIKVTRGILVEYAISIPPLVLSFEFNPETISRSRTITIQHGDLPGNRGGYGFTTPFETARAAQGVSMDPESFSIRILLDATDRMDQGDAIATAFGIQPEIDTLRTMVEPKVQGPPGMQVLSSLGALSGRANDRREHPSVLLFAWGYYVLPVFLTSVRVDEKAHLPSLMPYRAEAELSMQVIESSNIFYDVEKVRQLLGAAVHLASEVSGAIEGVL